MELTKNSRFCILYGDGFMERTGEWTESDGLFYSNTSFRAYKYKTTNNVYTSWDYENEYWSRSRHTRGLADDTILDEDEFILKSKDIKHNGKEFTRISENYGDSYACSMWKKNGNTFTEYCRKLCEFYNPCFGGKVKVMKDKALKIKEKEEEKNKKKNKVNKAVDKKFKDDYKVLTDVEFRNKIGNKMSEFTELEIGYECNEMDRISCDIGKDCRYGIGDHCYNGFVFTAKDLHLLPKTTSNIPPVS